MEGVIALVVGVIFATGIYLILRRSTVRLIMGLLMLTHAANLVIFTGAGLRRGSPPLLEVENIEQFADPLPQALILTAIVIGFGLSAFTLVLAYRVNQTIQSDDLDELRSVEE
jgi:multicomponent Na+:H+ antiporter subunit C